MAYENKTQNPAPKLPSLSDIQARDHFIAVALREIVADQLANNKWNADMAATWAVRYANAVMAVRATDTTPLKVVVSKGQQNPVPALTESVTELVTKEPVKSIEELIKDEPETEEGPKKAA